jgi:hypothetical protein
LKSCKVSSFLKLQLLMTLYWQYTFRHKHLLQDKNSE